MKQKARLTKHVLIGIGLVNSVRVKTMSRQEEKVFANKNHRKEINLLDE